MQNSHFIDRFIDALRNSVKSIEIDKLNGIERIIKILHQMQLNPGENYDNYISKSAKLMKDYHCLNLANERMMVASEVQKNQTYLLYESSSKEIETRQKCLIDLKLKRNQIVHSSRKQIELLEEHIQFEKSNFEALKRHMLEEISLLVDNHTFKETKCTDAMKILKNLYLSAREERTIILDTWVKKYDQTISDQEKEIEFLRNEIFKVSEALLKVEEEFEAKNKVVERDREEELKKDKAKKQMEMQVTAILLLQRWWRKKNKKSKPSTEGKKKRNPKLKIK
eukprot:NODE_33_length_36935_cov_1.609241.p17 type:complete len:281 gc:universal NODE_33_length_36935_cov_1.609241:20576-19734(-)